MPFSYLVLRVVHILAGTCWAGAAVLLAFFVEPAVRATGPAGGTFMQRLAGPGRLSLFMSVNALLTTLTGLLLYWPVSSHVSLAWMGTSSGLALTVGSVAGVTAFVEGLIVNAPAASRMATLGAEMRAASGGPTPAQLAELARIQRRLQAGGRTGAILLIAATVGMAAAKYLF